MMTKKLKIVVGSAQAAARVALLRVRGQPRTGPEGEPTSARSAVSRRSANDSVCREGEAEHRDHTSEKSETQARLQNSSK